MSTAEMLRSLRGTDVDAPIFDELADWLETRHAELIDECDAPADWDSGNVCFDPYL